MLQRILFVILLVSFSIYQPNAQSDLLQQAEILTDSTKYEEALIILDEAEGVVQYRKGYNHYSNHSFYQSITHFEKAIKLLPSHNPMKIQSYRNIGYILSENTKHLDYLEAVTMFHKALMIDSSDIDAHQLGVIYQIIGDYDRSKTYYKLALKLLEKQDSVNQYMADEYIGLGDIHQKQGELSDAFEMFNKADSLLNEEQLPNVKVYNRLANLAFEQKKYNKSIDYYKNTLEQLKDTLEIARVTNSIGTCYIELGKWDNAKNMLEKALKEKLTLKETGEVRSSIASSYYNLAEYYSRKKEFIIALNYYQHAINLLTNLELPKHINNIDSQKIPSLHLPDTLSLQKSINRTSLVLYLSDQAKTWQSLYKTPNHLDSIQYLENVFSIYQKTDMLIHFLLNSLTPESQLDWMKKVRGIYENAIDVAYQLYKLDKDKAYLESAFNFAESNKAVILQKKIQLYSQREYKRLSNVLNRIQTELHYDDVLIEYFVGENSIYIFGITKNNIRCESVIYSETLKSEINNFNQYTETGPNGIKVTFHNYIKNAHSIYETLVQPILKKSNRIVIVPDDILFHVSFAALLTSPTKPKDFDFNLPYLIKKHPITYTPSVVSLLNMPKQETPSSFKNLGIYAPKVFDYKNTLGRKSELTPLDSLQKMATILHDRYGGHLFNDTVLLNDFYTSFQDYETLIMATHAKASDTIDNSGYIVFSDEVLNIDRIYNDSSLNFKNKCIILSTCEGADGYLQTGEGIMNITRAFIYKGSSNVISALWSVDDDKTSIWLSHLSKYLSKNYDKSKALQLAQKDLIETNPHPFYWAAFTHTGTWEAENTSFFAKNNFLILLIGIGLVSIFFAWWRKKR